MEKYKEYKKDHRIALNLEKKIIGYLGWEWKEYDNYIEKKI